MKKVIVVLLMLVLAVTAVQADVTFTPGPDENWAGYMNVYDLSGGYLWGSDWGQPDLRANFIESSYIHLQLNVGSYNPDDEYWVDPVTGLGAKRMEANFYYEYVNIDFAGETAHFDFRVKSNTLPEGTEAYAFFKVFAPGYSFIGIYTEDLTVGDHTLSLPIESGWDGYILQIGFQIIDVPHAPESPEAETGVVIGYKGGQPPVNPVPADNSGYPADSTTLSWSNPDPNDPAEPITAVVYLYESDLLLETDPNMGPEIIDEEVQTLVVNPSQDSANVALSANKHYYWKVYLTDTGLGTTVSGPIWYFQTADSAPTNISAGVDQYVWLEDGAAQFTLTGSYTDDAKSDVTVLWEDLSNPLEQAPGTTVTINSPDTAVTTVDVDGDGWYLFQITVTDAVGTGLDQCNVGVYVNACEAAKADPGDISASYPDGHGDIDGDCDVDLVDFALVAGSWLDCMSTKLGCN